MSLVLVAQHFWFISWPISFHRLFFINLKSLMFTFPILTTINHLQMFLQQTWPSANIGAIGTGMLLASFLTKDLTWSIVWSPQRKWYPKQAQLKQKCHRVYGRPSPSIFSDEGELLVAGEFVTPALLQLLAKGCFFFLQLCNAVAFLGHLLLGKHQWLWHK